jgi:hypothetical protein
LRASDSDLSLVLPTNHQSQPNKLIPKTQTFLTTPQGKLPEHITTKKQQRSSSKMFPQPDASTLSRNPQFAHLWKDLTTNKITRDGVSKPLFLDRNTIKTRETLKSKRIESVKGQVVRDAVRAVAFGEGEGGLVGEVSVLSRSVWKGRN